MEIIRVVASLILPKRNFLISLICLVSIGVSFCHSDLRAADTTRTALSINLKKQSPHIDAGGYIENRGQFPKEVRYLSQAPGVALWITNTGIVYDIHHDEYLDTNGNQLDRARLTDPRSRVERLGNTLLRRTGSVVRMRFADASVESTGSGDNLLSGTYNYFHGGDSSQWVTNVPRFSQVNEENLYHGITARFYFENDLPRYDLILQPVADLSEVRMQFEGQDSLRVTDAGALQIATSMGLIEQQGLVAYQLNNGVRHEIKCRFVLEPDGSVGFTSEAYDRNLALVVDPLLYSTFVGGSDDETATSIALDRNGEAFIAGWSQSTNYPTTVGAYQTTSHGSEEVFVSRLSADGSKLLYSTYLGGSSIDEGYGIAVDAVGHAFVTGFTNSGNPSPFPTTPGAYQTALQGNYDIFVTKLDTGGNKLLYSTFVGALNVQVGYGICLDSSGDAYVTGYTNSRSYPTTSGAYQTSSKGPVDAFITKLNSTGTALVYSTYLSGTQSDYGTSIALDRSGNAYVGGYTSSTDYPITAQAFQTTSHTNTDGFITKLNASGSALAYSTYLGGSSTDEINAIAVDDSGNAYVTGYTSSAGTYPTGFPVSNGAFQSTYHGSNDGFVTKLNASGSALVYSTYFGGSNQEIGYGIALDSLSDAYITGYTYSHDFPITSNAFQPNFGGEPAVFLSVLNSSGALDYSTYLFGTYDQIGYGVAVNQTGVPFVTGDVASPNYPVTTGAFQTTHDPGKLDAFVTALILPGGILGIRVDSSVIPLCSTSLASITLIDSGLFAMQVDSVWTAAPYQLSSLAFPFLIRPQDSTHIPIIVTPGQTGYITGTVHVRYISATGLRDTAITLRVLVVDNSQMVVSATAPDTATACINSIFTIPIRDSGCAILHVINATVSGGRAANFLLLSQLPITLGPDSSTLLFILTSVDTPGTYSATLSVSYSDQNDSLGILTIPLNAIMQANYAAAYAKPQTIQGKSCDTLGGAIPITTTGCSPLQVVSCTFSGPDSSEFLVLDQLPVTISGNSAGSIRFGSTAIVPGTHTAQAHLHSTFSDGSSSDTTVTVTANIIGGDYRIGYGTPNAMAGKPCDSVVGSAQVTMSGCIPLEVISCALVGPDSAMFTILDSFPLDIAANGAGSFAIRCIAPNPGTYTCELDIRSIATDGVIHDTIISFSAQIIGGYYANFNAPTVLSGAPCDSLSGSISIIMNGCDPLQILSCSFTGPNADVFAAGVPFPFNVSPNGTGSIPFKCLTTTPGTYHATARVTYVSTDAFQHTATLSLTAIIIAGYQVTYALSAASTGPPCDNVTDSVGVSMIGCIPLQVVSCTLSGQDASHFSLASTMPLTIAPDGSASVLIQCTAATTGTYTCQAHLHALSADSVSHDTDVTITAVISGIGGYAIAYTPTAPIAGTLCDKNPSDSIMLAMTGCTELQVVSCKLSGAGAGQFSVVTAFPFTVTANGAGNIAIACTAASLGAYGCQANIHSVTNDGLSHDTTISISAKISTITPQISAPVTSIDFDTVSTCFFADTSFVLTNSGCDTLSLDSLSGVSIGGLTLSGVQLPVRLAPGASAEFLVHYAPPVAGIVNSALTFHASEQGNTTTLDVNLKAVAIRGASTLAFSSTTMNFGQISVCSDAAQPLSFTSNGCDTVQVSSESLGGVSGFTIANAHGATLPPQAKDSILVSFVPPGVGVFRDTIAISTNAGVRQIILQAQGVPDSGHVGLSTTSIAFTTVTAGCSTSAGQVIFRNTTCDKLTIDSLTAFPAAFSASTISLPYLLGHDSSLNITGKFAPLTSGAYTGSIILYYTTADGKQHDTVVTLTAAAIDPPKIGISLKPGNYTAAAGATTPIPLCLVGSLDRPTSLSIGLQSVSITLSLDSDFLAPVSVTQQLAGIDSVQMKVAGNSTTITVWLPQVVTFTDSTALLSINCKSFLTTSLETRITLTDAAFSSSGSSCFDYKTPDNVAFTLVGCGDSVISGTMSHSPAFSLQSIYPNPTAGTLNLGVRYPGTEVGEIAYELDDALGRIARGGTISGTTATLDLENLSSGSYYLRLSQGGFVLTRRVVLER